MMILRAFLQCEWYGLTDRFSYPRVVNSCGAGGALLDVPSGLIRFGDVLGIWRLVRNRAVGPVLALAATGTLTGIDWKASEER